MKRLMALVLSMMLALLPVTQSMAAVVLPASLKVIQAEVFAGDASVTGTLSLPSGVERVGRRAFAETGLHGLWMPSGVKAVEGGILEDSSAVYAVIPSISATLADDALAGVPFLVGSSNGSLARWAQDKDVSYYDFQRIIWQDGFAFAYDNGYTYMELLFPSADSLSGEVTIPAYVGGIPVKAIGEYAFANLSGLTQVHVPSWAELPENPQRWNSGLVVSTYQAEAEAVVPGDETEKVEMAFYNSAISLNVGDMYWADLVEYPFVNDIEWTWYSSDESVVQVQDGEVTAVGLGEAAVSLWVECEDGVIYYAVMHVSVCEKNLQVFIHDDVITMPAGELRVIDWSLSGSSIYSEIEREFSSSDEDVATVNDIGYVTAVAPGEAVITMTVKQGEDETAAAQVPVIVTEQELELNHTLLNAYDLYTYQLEVVTNLPEDAQVVWSSSKDAIRVDENGAIQIIPDISYGDGLVTCTVTYADGTVKTASCWVSYVDFVLDFVEYAEPFYMVVGETSGNDAGLAYCIHDADFDDLRITAVSSDPSIVALDEELNLIALKEGEATVTFTAAVLDQTATMERKVVVEAPYLWADLHEDETEAWKDWGMHQVGYSYDSAVAVDQLTFTSSDPNVFKAYPNGIIVPVNEGTATLTFTVGAMGYTATDTMQVTVYGRTLALSPEETTISAGETIQLVLVTGDAHVNYRDFAFMTSDPTVAYVDGEGHVTGLQAGTAQITLHANVNDQNSIATAVVNVVDDSAAFALNATRLDMERGDTFQLQAMLNGEECTDVTWSVTDTGMMVSQDGLLTMRHDWPEHFAAYVIATTVAGGETLTAKCMVRGARGDVTLDAPSAMMLSVGDENFIGTDWSSSVEGETYTLTFESSDETVAILPYGNGSVRAVGEGECEIIIRLIDSQGNVIKTRTCLVLVDKDPPEMESFELAQDVYFVTTPESDFNAVWVDSIVQPALYNSLTGVVYTLEDETVAAMNENGDHIVGLSEGVTTLTAALESMPDVTDTATVYVINPVVEASKEELAQGEILNLTVTGMPDDVDYTINWEYDDYMLRHAHEIDNTLVLRAWHVGETIVLIHLELPNTTIDIPVFITITGDEDDPRMLNETDVSSSVGDKFWLWPEFEAFAPEWSTTDENVAVVEQDGAVTVVGEGECDVVLAYTLEGETYTAACHVIVGEGSWSLEAIHDVPEVMLAGSTYYPNFQIDSTFGAWPENIKWYVGNEDVLEITEDGGFYAKAAGVSLISLVAEEGEQVETLRMGVRVVEPAVRLQQNYYDIRPGITFDPMLQVAQGKEVEAIEVMVEDNQALTVNDDQTITVQAESGSYMFTVTVALTDGSVRQLAGWVYVVADQDIWVSAHIDDPMFLGVGEFAPEATEKVLPLHIDTNASEQEITITWASSDESVVTLGEPFGFAGSDVTIYAAGSGDAEISCHVMVGEDGSIFNETFYSHVHVEEGFVNIISDWDSTEAWVGEPIGMNAHVDHNVPLDRWVYTTSDANVAIVNSDGLIIPVGAGTAQITMTVWVGDYSTSRTVEVNVRGRTMSLTPENVTLNKGESVMLAPVFDLPEGEQADFHDKSIHSSDESIAAVTYEGVVTGMSAGSALITFESRVNGDMLLAYSLVTVVDPEAPLALNASEITLEQGKTYQLTPIAEGEVTGVVWSSSDENRATVDENGLVTMHDAYRLDDVTYITCTALVDGVEASAVCMLRSTGCEARLEGVPEILAMGVEDMHGVHYVWSSRNPEGVYYVTYEVEDESIAYVDENLDLVALSRGVTTMTVTLYNEQGEACDVRKVMVYVETELPELETLNMEHEYYVIGVEGTHFDSTHINIFMEPSGLSDHYPQIITSADPDVVRVDGHQIYGVNEGETTITLTLDGVEGWSDTATVYVVNPQLVTTATAVNAGDAVSMQVVGMPESMLEVNYGWEIGYPLELVMENGADAYMRAVENGEALVFVHLSGENYGFALEQTIQITGDMPRYTLSDRDIVCNVGDTHGLGTNFGCSEMVWSSTDENVAVVDKNGNVTMMGLGECDIVLECIADEDGSAQRLTCHVIVIQGHWELTDLTHLPSTLVVGRGMQLDPGFNAWFSQGPEKHWWTIDEGEELAEIDEENNHLLANAVGIITLTMHVQDGDFYHAMSKHITIVEPKARMSEDYIGLFAGQTHQLEVIPASGMTIAAVEWFSGNESLAAVDEKGLVTGMEGEGRGMVVARVTFTDETEAYAICWVDKLSGSDVYLNTNMHGHLSLGAGDLMADRNTQEMNVELDTNAPEDMIFITWEIDDENVAVISDEPYGFAGSSVLLQGVSQGETIVRCIVRIGENGEYGESRHECLVTVEEGYINLTADWEELELYVGEPWGMDIHVDHNVPIVRCVYTTSDASVASINSDGLILPRSAGTADLTLTVYSGNASESITLRANVRGYTAALTPVEMTLQVGESSAVVPIIDMGDAGSLNIQGRMEYRTSNSAVANVTGEGMVTGVSAGSALISFEGEVNGEPVLAYCQVTVEDPAAKLQLSETNIMVARDMSYQLTYTASGDVTGDVIWSSSKEYMVTVDQNGLVTAHDTYRADETAYITCTAVVDGQTVTATCMVGTFSGEAEIINIGMTHCMSVEDQHLLEVQYGSSYPEQSFYMTYESSDDEVVTVDESGLMHAHKAGEATIAIKLYNAQDELCDTHDLIVFVDSEGPAMQSIALEEEVYILTLENGPQNNIHPNVFIEPEYVRELHELVLTSDNEGAVGVNGEDIFGIAVGEATVTAKLRDFDTTDTAKVYVVDPKLVMDKDSYQVGDRIVVTLEGIPAEIEDIHYQGGTDGGLEYILTDGNTMYLRATEPGQYNVWMDINSRYIQMSVNAAIEVSGSASQYQLNNTDLVMGVGDSYMLGTQFAAENLAWSTSDSMVAVVDDQGMVEAVKPGQCTITLTCTDQDGAQITLTCSVIVMEGGWEMATLDHLPTAITLGEIFWPDPGFSTWYGGGPEQFWWSIDDETVAKLWEDNAIEPLKEGSFTLTMHVKDGDFTTSMSKVILVSDPVVRMNSTYHSVRPGSTVALGLIAGQGKTIASAEWFSLDEAVLTVDQNGVVTARAVEGRGVVAALVTFTDQTTAYAMGYVDMIPDWEVYLDVHMEDYFELDVGEFANRETEHLVQLELYTNASEDELTVNWWAEDENILEITPAVTTDAPFDVIVTGKQGGSTALHCDILVGQDGSLGQRNLSCWVDVYEAYTAVEAQ